MNNYSKKHFYKDVTVLIVHFKNENIINQCLSRIDNKIKKIIIDNSENHQNLKINKKIRNINIIYNQNNGFGSSVNFGIKKIKTKYVFVICPDVFLKKNTIKILLEAAKKLNDKFAIIGPIPKRSSIKIKIKKNVYIPVKKIHGAALFINKKKFDKVNGFDENIFLFYEENDLCKRLENINEKMYLIQNARYDYLYNKTHYKKNFHEIECSRNWHYMWSRYYFFKKHYGIIIAVIFTFHLLFSYGFKSLMYSVTKKNKLLKYTFRFNGLLSSYMGLKSFYRPFKH